MTWAASSSNKPVNVIVAYGPGGGTDILIRGLVPYLQKELNNSVIVNNVPGANGVIGYNKAFKSPPDGNTLLMATVPTLYTSQLIYGSSIYRTIEFVPIYAFAIDSVILAANPEIFQDFDQFVKESRKRSLIVGVTGKGTPSVLGGQVLEKILGVKFTYVPVEGGAAQVGLLAGKHIDAAVPYVSTSMSMIRAGKIKPLIIYASERSPKYPEIPVPKEFGHQISPIYSLFGVWAPPNTAQERVKLLESAFDRAVRSPGYIEWSKKMPSDYVPLNAASFKSEIEKMVKIIDANPDFMK